MSRCSDGLCGSDDCDLCNPQPIPELDPDYFYERDRQEKTDAE
jgi:hypothetical protein